MSGLVQLLKKEFTRTGKKHTHKREYAHPAAHSTHTQPTETKQTRERLLGLKKICLFGRCNPYVMPTDRSNNTVTLLKLMIDVV